MKKLSLSELLNTNLSVGGTLKDGLYEGIVKDIVKTTKNNKSYIDLKVEVNGTLHSWRIFDVNRFKLEYKLATGSKIKKLIEIKGKAIKFYASRSGRFNNFSMLPALPEEGAYEVVYGGCAVSEEYSAYIIKLIFDETFTYFDIKYINSEEDLNRFANYTMSSIAYQFGYDSEFKIVELEDHVGEPIIVNIIKKEEYKCRFVNYDVIKVESLSEDDIEEDEDDIEEEF